MNVVVCARRSGRRAILGRIPGSAALCISRWWIRPLGKAGLMAMPTQLVMELEREYVLPN